MHYQTGIRFSHHILELKGTWETHNSNVKSKVCVYVFAEMVSCLWEDSSRERGVPTSWEAWPTMNDLNSWKALIRSSSQPLSRNYHLLVVGTVALFLQQLRTSLSIFK